MHAIVALRPPRTNETRYNDPALGRLFRGTACQARPPPFVATNAALPLRASGVVLVVPAPALMRQGGRPWMGHSG